MSVKRRVEYLDVAKGIAILSVVIGHTFASYDPGSMLNKWIYSFHMPLFFILSGYFFKSQSFREALPKKVRGLIFPYILINAGRCLVAIRQYGPHRVVLTDFFLPTLYGSGSSAKIPLSLVHVKIVGMTWFLLGLFFCQVIYLALDKLAVKLRVPLWLLVIPTAWLGIWMNDRIWLPFSLQPAMGALVFYHAGRRLREFRLLQAEEIEFPGEEIVLAAFLWILGVFFSSLGMHSNSYHNVAAMTGAVAATFLIVRFSRGILAVPLLGKFLAWCGKNSLYLYGFHALDRAVIYRIKRAVLHVFGLPSTKGALLFAVIRILLVVIGAYLFLLFLQYFRRGMDKIRKSR